MPPCAIRCAPDQRAPATLSGTSAGWRTSFGSRFRLRATPVRLTLLARELPPREAEGLRIADIPCRRRRAQPAACTGMRRTQLITIATPQLVDKAAQLGYVSDEELAPASSSLPVPERLRLARARTRLSREEEHRP